MYQSVSGFDHKMNTGFWAELFVWLFGQEEKDSEDIEDTKEYRCESCNKEISGFLGLNLYN